MHTKRPAPAKEKLTPAEKQKLRRDRIKENPDAYKTYKIHEASRARVKRQKMSDEQKARGREQARLRVMQCRARKKEQQDALETPKRQIRFTERQLDEKRERNRESQRKRREKMTGQERRREKEKALAYYHGHKVLRSEIPGVAPSFHQQQQEEAQQQQEEAQQQKQQQPQQPQQTFSSLGARRGATYQSKGGVKNISKAKTMHTKRPAPAKEKLTPAEKQKLRRDRIKENPDAYKTYKIHEASRARVKRQKMSDEQKARGREQARLRVMQCRARKKEQQDALETPKRQIRFTERQLDEKRERNRESQRKRREKMTGQERRREKEKALAYYHGHKVLRSEIPGVAPSFHQQQQEEAQQQKQQQPQQPQQTFSSLGARRGATYQSKEEANCRGRPQTGVPQMVGPQHKSFVLRPEELHLLQASKGAQVPKIPLDQVAQLDPVTRKITHVAVDLPDLPPGQSSGLDCRQPVLLSSGPASSECPGPQPCLHACAPFPVLLIGPREKEILSQLCLMQAASIEERVCQSLLQPSLSADCEEVAVPPVAVKQEPFEDSGNVQCFSEQVRTHTAQEGAEIPVEVKMEAAEEGSSFQGFHEHEVIQASQECAAAPVEVKMEAEDNAACCHEERDEHQTPEEFAMLPVDVKVEPVEEEGDDERFQEREVHQTPQDFALLPVEVKIEPHLGYPDTRFRCQVMPEPLDN